VVHRLAPRAASGINAERLVCPRLTILYAGKGTSSGSLRDACEHRLSRQPQRKIGVDK
jgi:hypothetical protein